jgi:hypothetical protein
VLVAKTVEVVKVSFECAETAAATPRERIIEAFILMVWRVRRGGLKKWSGVENNGSRLF